MAASGAGEGNRVDGTGAPPASGGVAPGEAAHAGASGRPFGEDGNVSREGAPDVSREGAPGVSREGAPREVTPDKQRDGTPPSLRDDDIFAVRPRPRASPLRVLGIVVASILVTAVLFRAAVEAVRAFVAG